MSELVQAYLSDFGVHVIPKNVLALMKKTRWKDEGGGWDRRCKGATELIEWEKRINGPEGVVATAYLRGDDVQYLALPDIGEQEVAA